MSALVGFDLVDVREVEESITRFGERYLTRVYTPGEIEYAMSAPDRATAARRLGARFAAKEATIKALGASERGISPRSIEVTRSHDGAIRIVLHGPASAAARDAGATALAVSVSHQGDLAGAVVVADEKVSTRRSRIRWKK
jgi:holo-[acyl-carrier protein] synthase